jgi:hypothetical protein
MGIRYYAYAFDASQTDRAMADPRAFIADDPLADAWGFEPGAVVFATSFEQAVPERDMLYLDKAWRDLQLLTRPPSSGEPARPAFRMFDGDVTYHGLGWAACARALGPNEMPEIARDLALLEQQVECAAPGGSTCDEGHCYVHHYLVDARRFAEHLARDGRGMAYLIG